MISYDKTGGTFPFTKNELSILCSLVSEKTSEIEENFEEKDPHVYIRLEQLNAKLNAIVWMIDRNGARENDK